MDDAWTEIDGMIAELGELFAVEVEAARFPEIAGEPAVREIHIAVLRATDEMQRLASTPRHSRDRAREALVAARASATAARALIVRARAARNRNG